MTGGPRFDTATTAALEDAAAYLAEHLTAPDLSGDERDLLTARRDRIRDEVRRRTIAAELFAPGAPAPEHLTA